MKQSIKKWTLRLTATGLLIAGLLLIIVLHPIITYADRTTHNNFRIYHNAKLDPLFLSHLDKVEDLLKTSELYNEKLQLDICLNDGSTYTDLMKTIRGQAFAWGFYDKVVLQGIMNCKEKYVELNDYKWNLTQLLAHEMTHCLQFDKFGLWKSNPVANIPNWKWEGYAEYVSRQGVDQKDLSKNLARLFKTDQSNWAVAFADGTISPREYYESWTMVQYCMDIKKMTYQEVLADTTSEQLIRQAMMDWQENNKSEHTASH